MPETRKLDDIVSQVIRLDKNEQLILLKHLIVLLKRNDRKSPEMNLSSISGIGAEIWKDTDIDNYVDQERQWG